MWELLVEPFTAGFMRRALGEVLILGVLGGVVGVYVLLRKLAFLIEVVQHTVFPGIAVAFVLDQSVLLGAAVTGLLSVVLLSVGNWRRRVDLDALMALLVASFFAVGVAVVSRRTGFQNDLTALLFGRILAVDQRLLIETAIVAAGCLAVLALVHKELVLRAFDPTACEALGYPAARLDLLLGVIVTLTVVAAVQAVGTVLVLAFIVTPVATARLLSSRIAPMMAWAVGVAAVGGYMGLVVSYRGSVEYGWRLASGATIVVVLTVLFLVVAAGRSLVSRRRLAVAL